MILELVEPKTCAVLRVIGCGGAGGNAVNGMVQGALKGVEFIAMNSDAQALEQNLASTKVQLGANTTHGLGCGGKSELGRQSAEESLDDIRSAVRGADMVFVTVGMGGGTGTGSVPIVARVAREEGALTVAVVTKPFQFEGKPRMKQAEEGLELLRHEVDTLIVIPNQRLLTMADTMTSLLDAFKKADEVLFQGTRGISDLITNPGLINLDFADVKSVMSARGNALMGTGMGEGENKAEEAARMAISSPLLEDVSITGAEAVLVNICGGKDLGLHTIEAAMAIINEAVGTDANLIMGAVIDPELKDSVRITVIATGFGEHAEMRPLAEPRTQEQAGGSEGAGSEREPVSAQPGQGTVREPVGVGGDVIRDRWERTHHQERLDVPAFIRKQMD